jgi:CHAT domain-containing protein
LFENVGQWKAVDAAYQEALQASGQLGPVVRERLLWKWAQAFHHRSEWDKAEALYRQGLAESQDAGAENMTAQFFNVLGFLAQNRGDLGKEEEYFRKALVIREKLEPGTVPVGASLLNLGTAALDHGDLAQAEEYERRALAIYDKIDPGGNGVATILNNLGEVAGQRGDLRVAEDYLRRALAIKMKLAPGGPDVGSTLGNLGLVADQQGNFNEAQEYLRQSLSIWQRVLPGSLEESATLLNLGDVAQHNGQLAEAQQNYTHALELERKLFPEAPLTAATLKSLGDVMAKAGDLASAEAYYQRALAIREKVEPGTKAHAESLAGLATVMRRSGRIAVAAELYQQALNALESQMARFGGSEDVRSRFRATYQNYYKEYLDLLMTQNHPDLAFNVSERSRARSFLEMLTANRLEIHKGADPALLVRKRDVAELLRGKINQRLRLLSEPGNEKRIQVLGGEINDLLRQQEEVEASIRTSSPGYAALTQPQPLNAKAVQQLLPDHTLLLEYSLGENRSYVFAVTANSLNSYELPKRAEIEGKATHLYQVLTERSRIVDRETDRKRRARVVKADEEFRNAAVELSRMLLGPVAADLQQRRLLIVSDGALQYLPFAALPAPEVSSAKASKPLMLQHEIINLPSASVLALARRNHASAKEVAVFADPVFDRRDVRVKLDPVRRPALSDDTRPLSVPPTQLTRDLARSVADTSQKQNGELHLPRLAFTRDEAKAILAVVPQGSSMEAIDFNASRKLAMSGELARFRVVHFATHALVDDIHPPLSGLVLSLVDQRGEPTDGFLELQDIYNLELSADLVVLSACQTALGKEINGEGMIGLTRGFMYAGASSVVATLWKVNDFATAKLMAHFYKAMERDGMKPAQALRHAQLALWNEQPLAAPYYWAGFILQGFWQ